MNYRLYGPLLLLILVSLVACAQEKYSIKSARLFSRVQMPGNIPVNDKGEPLAGPDTTYSAVVETSGKPVQWQAAFTRSTMYTITPSLISTLPYDAGTSDATGQKILLTPAKGNQLWLLELAPTAARNSVRPATTNLNTMLLQGKAGNKMFTYPIRQPINIRMIPVY